LTALRSAVMDRQRAAELAEAWRARHPAGEEPAPDAEAAVVRTLGERVPEPEAAAAVTEADGRPRVAALADGALYLVWAVRGSAGVRDAARCRRVPLAPGRTVVEVSERLDGELPVRHWWFELEAEPLVFRTVGDDEPERLARAIARALGWPD
jgi:hypothetical protein